MPVAIERSFPLDANDTSIKKQIRDVKISFTPIYRT